MSQQIRLLKLTSGEEIIGKLVKSEDNHVILSSIRTLIMQPVGPGQVQIGMIPWMAGMQDGDVRIHRDRILGEPVSDVSKQLEDGYLQQTSGIQIATGSDIK